MAFYLVFFLLFLLQFVYFPIGVSHFETPKVYVAEILIFLILILKVLKPDNFSLSKFNKNYLISIGLILFLSLYHLLFLSTSTTFFGNAFRLQGVFMLWMFILLAFLTAKISFDKKIKPNIIFVILAVQFVFTLLIDGGVNSRGIGTLGEPNALAATIIFVWPFLYFTKNKKEKIFKTASILLAFVIIFASGSRSGMVTFILQILFILLTTRFKFSMKKSVVICLIFLGFSFVLPFIGKNGIYENRGEIWQSSIIAGLKKSILGHGFGNTEYVFKNVIKRNKNNLNGSYVDSAHNIFLDWFIQGGVVGLIILIFILLRTFLSFLKSKNIRNIVLLLGIIAALSFNPASIVSLVALWWLIGQGSVVS